MTATRLYSFRRATLGDLALVTGWQALPHVGAWWGSDPAYDAADLADPRVALWIVSVGNRPFAYMQDYAVHGWDDHHFAALPPGTRGIDQFIGDPAMIGQGHGTAFIAARVRALFAAGAPVVATDPHPDNARAIAVYRKVGLRVFGAPRETEWGLILPMRADRRP